MSSGPVVAVSDKPGVNDLGTRFGFGRNWRRFLRFLDDERIDDAEKSLRSMLEIERLNGKSFLDAGCGSGLFSLVAMRLGASRVYSFDYDPESVACTRELKDRYFQEAGNWTIEQGDVLHQAYLSRLGQFDVVYSWGVLHHTGDMWRALRNVVPLVSLGGKLFIAIYNDQGMSSRVWARVKRLYSRWPWLRPALISFFAVYLFLRGFAADLLLRRKNPFARYRRRERPRGMAFWPDFLDWLGGYPFEVAKADAVFDFFRDRGFKLQRLKTVGGGNGNNEFVFTKSDE